jgi:DNA helicase-2/ATP-dependent DNA helicase PcrA
LANFSAPLLGASGKPYLKRTVSQPEGPTPIHSPEAPNAGARDAAGTAAKPAPDAHRPELHRADAAHSDGGSPQEDPELHAIVGEEERCLERVVTHVHGRPTARAARRLIDYDRQLIDLRDQIAQARLEDVPPLLEQMERLQNLAARQGQSTAGHVDARSPYFGRMVLREDKRNREILIGRSTYVDTRAGVRIVDWRDAPVSRLFYRYNEGVEYEETFGERDVEGEIITRRSLTIVDSRLRRIVAPQGVFVRQGNEGEWRRGGSGLRLAGGQGSALRADHHHRPGKLGVGADEAGEDRHLKAITALIDPRQFELITKPDSGLVVIQGGAGSGKTTIGLHRLAYLAFQDKRRFRPDRMLVIAFNQALVRYISQVLPALDVTGVGVRTYTEWANRLRVAQFPDLTRKVADDTPSVVTRLKKHPAMLRAIDDHVEQLAAAIEARLNAALADDGPIAEKAVAELRASRGRPLAHRLHALSAWVDRQGFSGRPLNVLEREIRRGLSTAQDVVGAWSELITDKVALTRAFDAYAPGQFTPGEINKAHEWCSAQSALVLLEAEQLHEAAAKAAQDKERDKDRAAEKPPRRAERQESRTAEGGDTDAASGDADAPEEEQEPTEEAQLDAEDDTLLLRFSQRLKGPLLRPGAGQEALSYEHILIDEAQDMSPVELAVVTQTVSGGQSITLAGDVAQRLYMDNGFTGWNDLLSELGLSHVQVEPLQITYRSTEQVTAFAHAVLGPLAPPQAPVATRLGAPVELFGFAHSGDAVGFLAEALRELSADEPQASIAVVARYPEQADLYHAGLRQAEIPNLRRVAEQDFPFKAGVDVTDLRQVKGLEFDYVILVEVNQSTYPVEDESRHLLHIGATRAAHQLWILSTGKASELLPQSLRDHEY